MSQPDLPLNRAHQHAANAEDHWNNGLLILAAEEHFKAADAYLAAVERSNDESAKRTLRMLYNDHHKAGNDLQRKIHNLKEEGRDPSLPQKQERSSSPVVHALHPTASSGVSTSQRSAPSPPLQRPMTDTVDESFMLLGGQRSDPGDAFNQFWTIMQGMLDNLSQPVAFATAPLGSESPDFPSGSGLSHTAQLKREDINNNVSENDEHILTRLSRRIGIGREGLRSYTPEQKGASFTPDDFEDVDDLLEGGDELSESFCLVSTAVEPSLTALKRENARLKTEADATQKRLEAMERVIQLRKEQDLQLRESIFLATREAQRAMGASGIVPRPGVDLPGLNANVPHVPLPTLNTGREAQYLRRIKELEEEIRTVRAENERNKAMITKYRERWEKLKESAKRKKEAKASVSAASVRERIIEEPEAEEELDATVTRPRKA
ncbi:hypothetical protein AMATHDRAFT_74173 [Amanita thiersii Skay4041]|uniref:MIT domain-containing protein n=1 Tax=Amanita thiersii Skay4041 TaxID=703135 RepID=A0A2A9NWZ6_9AGAR|nr:hypothetical protein AMATHDRAFT_74173 [Amanita thiersii Skay4041]